MKWLVRKIFGLKDTDDKYVYLAMGALLIVVICVFVGLSFLYLAAYEIMSIF